MFPGTYAEHDPGRVAMIMAGSGQQLTYGELEQRSVRLANVLRSAGLRRGDTVALLTGNSIRAYEVYWAAMRSGMYLTAVNRHLTPAEVSYIVGDSGASALIASAALPDAAERSAADARSLRVRLAYGGSLEGFDDYEAALESASARPPADQPRGADLLYSSGTTGLPKGVRPPLPDHQVDEQYDGLTTMTRMLFGFDADTVYLSPAPVYHAAPLRFGAAVQAVGGTLVMMEKFDPADALAAIERWRVTHSQWVPTMFVRMLKLPEQVRQAHDLSSHRVAIHAAAPCPVDVKRAMMRWWGPILHEYYAATESNGMTAIDPHTWLDKPGSVGKAVLGVVRVCDDEYRELPPGEVGTVYFERETVPFEYVGDPEKTRAAQHLDHPHWTTTGDLGYVDEDGYLFLTDRRAFTIISGGVNIYPQEVENVLNGHPDVEDVAVFGIPDEEMGESVKAVVQTAADVSPGPELERELTDYVRARIAGYKIPRSIDFVEALPRTPTGKLIKGELKRRYVEG